MRGRPEPSSTSHCLHVQCMASRSSPCSGVAYSDVCRVRCSGILAAVRVVPASAEAVRLQGSSVYKRAYMPATHVLLLLPLLPSPRTDRTALRFPKPPWPAPNAKRSLRVVALGSRSNSSYHPNHQPSADIVGRVHLLRSSAFSILGAIRTSSGCHRSNSVPLPAVLGVGFSETTCF